MNNKTLCAIVIAYIFARTAFSFDGPQSSQSSVASMSLNDALKGNGSLVILKDDTISGRNPDGSPAYQQDVIYYGATESLAPNPELYAKTAGTFTCTAMVQTIDKNYDPGADISFKAGTSYAWDNDFLSHNEVDSFTNTSGTPYQGLRMTFSASGSKLSVLYCTVVGPRALLPLTVQDFEDATGGRMTLRPQQ